jgi:hypothetical protein
MRDFRKFDLGSRRLHRLQPFFWVAALLQWLIAATNFFAARIFHYRDQIAKLTPFVREVFIVQNVYIMAVVATFGVLCIAFGPDLAGRSALGRFLSGCLAIFWAGRVAIQLFFYEKDVKHTWPIMNIAFLVSLIYLSALFTVAALGLAR